MTEQQHLIEQLEQLQCQSEMFEQTSNEALEFIHYLKMDEQFQQQLRRKLTMPVPHYLDGSVYNFIIKHMAEL